MRLIVIHGLHSDANSTCVRTRRFKKTEASPASSSGRKPAHSISRVLVEAVVGLVEVPVEEVVTEEDKRSNA